MNIGAQENKQVDDYGFHIEEDFTEEGLTGLRDLDSSQKCPGCGVMFNCVPIISFDTCPFCQIPMKFNTSKEYFNVLN